MPAERPGTEPAELGAALRVPKAPAGSRWVTCEGCRESWLLPRAHTLCPDCDEARQRDAEARRLRGWRREHRETFLRAGGVPPRLAALEPGAVPPIPAPAAAWTGDPWSLTLHGPPGAGTSALAIEIAHRFLCSETAPADPVELPGFRWIRADTLISDILQGRRTGRRERRAPLLLLDHLGAGARNPTAWAVIAEVLAERHDWHRPTLITTHLTPAALHTAHPAIAERLRAGRLCPLAPRGKP